MYLENVLSLMNESDEKLVDKVIKSFAAIINGLPKENQFPLIPLIKDCIENIAIVPVPVGNPDSTHPLFRNLYKK